MYACVIYLHDHKSNITGWRKQVARAEILCVVFLLYNFPLIYDIAQCLFVNWCPINFTFTPWRVERNKLSIHYLQSASCSVSNRLLFHERILSSSLDLRDLRHQRGKGTEIIMEALNLLRLNGK
jgi:hypothetical protein